MLPEKLKLLFVGFTPAAAGPQRFAQELFAADAFRSQIDVQTWYPEDTYRGLRGKFKLLQDVRHVLQTHAPQLVYLNHDLSLNVWLAVTFRMCGARRLAAFSNATHYPMPALKWRISQFLMRTLVHSRLALSEDAGRAMFGNAPVTCFPSYIDFAALRACPRQHEQPLQSRRADFQFACVGRYSTEKNQLLLIDAFALLRQRVATIPLSMPKLLLIGEGPQQAALAQAIAAHDLEAHVTLIPAQDDMAAWYQQQTDALLVPSIYEGQGRVVAEAQAFGIPVAASNAVPEFAFINPDSAVRQLPARPDAWCDAMLMLMQSQRQDAPSLQALQESHLSMHHGAQRFVQLLRDCESG